MNSKTKKQKTAKDNIYWFLKRIFLPFSSIFIGFIIGYIQIGFRDFSLLIDPATYAYSTAILLFLVLLSIQNIKDDNDDEETESWSIFFIVIIIFSLVLFGIAKYVDFKIDLYKNSVFNIQPFMNIKVIKPSDIKDLYINDYLENFVRIRILIFSVCSIAVLLSIVAKIRLKLKN